jgi:hypothetical protein
MGVPSSEVGYTSATTGRGDHEVHKGHVVGLERKKYTRGSQKIRFPILLPPNIYSLITHFTSLHFTIFPHSHLLCYFSYPNLFLFLINYKNPELFGGNKIGNLIF